MVGVIGASTFMNVAQLTTLPRRIPCHNHKTSSRGSHEKRSFNSLPFSVSSSCAFSLISGSRLKFTGSVSSYENAEPSKVGKEVNSMSQGEKFDWYSQWYPVMPVCDLHKRVPHGKRVIGLDVVVWWDRNESQWKVFNDSCPHRLAPLSEGRIDQQGRLQCVYHGWCFSGSGDCKLIPQAPPDGPPVHKCKKACAAVYPSIVQNGIVWFWPTSNVKLKDILQHKKPPFMPELDDPSFRRLLSNRDIPYGYEVLVENLLDPSHIQYAHYGLLHTQPSNTRVDREGGRPLEVSVEQLDIKGFIAKHEWGHFNFIAPCVIYGYSNVVPDSDNTKGSSLPSTTSKDSSMGVTISQHRAAVGIFICIPVSPGKSRLIWAARDFTIWMDQILPRWILHVRQNLVIDSDLRLVHVQEQTMMEYGPSNWRKVCFVPTKADVLVVGYRRWLNQYSHGQVDWGDRINSIALPPPPPREQLFDRYWSHVVNCSSCNSAYKALNVTKMVLQLTSVVMIGAIGLLKQATLTSVQRTTLLSLAILCFAASKWMSHFVYKTFCFHDYNHAFK